VRVLFICLALSGCAAAQETGMTHVAGALEAVKSAWRAACAPVPPGAEEKCADAKDAVNKAVEVYTETNNVLKEADK
jgi:hypothetical protein